MHSALLVADYLLAHAARPAEAPSAPPARAEECAVRNGESNMSRHRRLLSAYRAVKGSESADISG